MEINAAGFKHLLAFVMKKLTWTCSFSALSTHGGEETNIRLGAWTWRTHIFQQQPDLRMVYTDHWTAALKIKAPTPLQSGIVLMQWFETFRNINPVLLKSVQFFSPSKINSLKSVNKETFFYLVSVQNVISLFEINLMPSFMFVTIS